MPKTLLFLLALVVLGALWIASYRRSLRTHPYALCRSCDGAGLKHGALFTHAWRECHACGGTGRRLRLGARSH